MDFRNPTLIAALGIALLALSFGLAFTCMGTEDEERLQNPAAAGQSGSQTMPRRSVGETPKDRASGEQAQQRHPASRHDHVGKAVIGFQYDDGDPVTGAQVELSPDGLVRKTDEKGRVSFSASDASHILTLHQDGWADQKFTVTLTEGLHSILIPRGQTLRGIFLMGEQPPQGSVGFTFEYEVAHDTGQVNAASHDAPKVVAGQSDPGRGEFVIHGLPQPLRGFLKVAQGFEIIGTGRSLGLRIQSFDFITVRLKKLPMVTGRVVQERTGEPVAGAIVKGRVRVGRFQRLSRTRTGMDGRFCLPIRNDRYPLSGVLQVLSGGSVTEEEFQLEGGRDSFAGDIEVPDLRDVFLVIEDPQGHGIDGALATTRGVFAVTARSGEQGHLRLPGVSSAMEEIEVGALHFESALVRIDEVSTRQLPGKKVILRPAPSLRIRIEDERGRSASGCIVDIRAEQLMFGSGMSRPSKAHTGLGASSPRLAMKREDEYSCEFLTDKKGIVTLEGLVADLPLRISVRTQSQFPLAQEVMKKTPHRGTLELPIRVSSEALEIRNISVLVTDAKNMPLADARVTLGTASFPGGLMRMSNKDGWAKFRNIQGTEFLISVTKTGFMPHRHSLVISQEKNVVSNVELQLK